MSIFNSEGLRFLSKYLPCSFAGNKSPYPRLETVAERCQEISFPVVFSMWWKILPDNRCMVRTVCFLCPLELTRVQPRAPLTFVFNSKKLESRNIGYNFCWSHKFFSFCPCNILTISGERLCGGSPVYRSSTHIVLPFCLGQAIVACLQILNFLDTTYFFHGWKLYMFCMMHL